MSFLVVTLGTMSVYSSIALVSHNGATIGVFSTSGFSPLSTFMTGKVAGIPYLMLFDIALALLAGAVLRYTSYGRSLFAMGSNVEAARINGINVARVELSTYVLAGLSAGIGGLIQVGRLSGAAPQVDATQLMAVLAAVLIGGTAFSGGEGGIFGTVMGVLFLGVISNGLTISEVSAFWQGAVNGGILLLAVLLSTARDRAWFKRRPKPAPALTVAPPSAVASTG
jgi:ribose/xylose/arabinose/galactoside ABC-type transport system permease subunit